MKLGVKGRKAVSLAVKGAAVLGAIGGIGNAIGSKATHSVENKKEEVEALAEAGKVLGGAVKDIGVAAVADIKQNPLGAKKAVAKSKQMVVGVVGAGKADPVGAAAQVQFAVAPKTTGEVNIKGATAYARPDPAGRVVDRGGFSSASGGGDIRVCDKKYGGKFQKNDKRNCKKRVKGGGMP